MFESAKCHVLSQVKYWVSSPLAHMTLLSSIKYLPVIQKCCFACPVHILSTLHCTDIVLLRNMGNTHISLTPWIHQRNMVYVAESFISLVFMSYNTVFNSMTREYVLKDVFALFTTTVSSAQWAAVPFLILFSWCNVCSMPFFTEEEFRLFLRQNNSFLPGYIDALCYIYCPLF